MGKIREAINGHTTISGVVGWPLTYTMSPAIHNRQIEKFNINSCYLPFRIEPNQLKETFLGFRSIENMLGLNITIPYKEKVISLIDELDEGAKIINSVNTVKFKDGQLKGYSTDGPGFLASLNDYNISLDNKKIIILGSGGASRAITAEIVKYNIAGIIIGNRDKSKETYFENISKDIDFLNYKEITINKVKDADIIINCTPVGRSYGDVLPIDLSSMKDGRCFYDLNYDSKLSFYNTAEDKNITVINGKSMLEHQASLSFKIFYGFLPELPLI